MALVEGFQKRERIPKLHPTQVICGWSTLADESGAASLLQLDTTGSEERENPGKQSQTVQFSRDSAYELYKILEMAFGFS